LYRNMDNESWTGTDLKGDYAKSVGDG